MQAATFRQLRFTLKNRIYSPGGANSREVVSHYATTQQDLYRRISHSILLRMRERGGDDENYNATIRAVTDSCITNAVANSPAEVRTISDGYILTSRVPVIWNELVDDMEKFVRTGGEGEDDIAAAYLGAIIFEFGRYATADLTQPTVARELASYAAWRAIDDAPVDASSPVSEKLAAILSSANTLLDDAKSQVAATANSLVSSNEQLKERASSAIEAAETAAKQAGHFDLLAKDLTGKINDFQVEIESKALDATEKLEGFLDAAKARTTYQHIVRYWDDRANASWWALLLSSGALAIFLVALPVAAIYENDAIIALLKHLTDATNLPLGTEPNAVVLTVATVSRLVVITIPLALYFWLIKLVVRFNMRSMLLMDDARQRSTIIETYYKMIEQQAATKEDRAMILQALCRPPPGHGGDSVDPPSLTDVVEKAVGKSVAA